MHEAKSNLSKLVERVEGGEEIVIRVAGSPPRDWFPSVKVVASRSSPQTVS
jgi:antitoxin (DNA-binding transcriptional repressor) of toxin-antitoxin stability system